MSHYVKKETAYGNKVVFSKDHHGVEGWLCIFSGDQGQLHIL